MEKGQPDPEICDERDTGIRIPLKIGGTMINLCLCHRDPERSIKIFGRILPICARCTGIFLGSFFAMMLIFTGNRTPLFICILLLIPLVVDGMTQLMKLRMSNNPLRLITGTLFGIGYVLLLVGFLDFITYMLIQG